MKRRILFLGYGYSARATARLLRAEGWCFAATARTAEKAAAIQANGGEAVEWNQVHLPDEAMDRVDAILVSTPPQKTGCPAFAAASNAVAKRSGDINWIGYLSSNGVYGDHQGRVVNEDSQLHPSSARARLRIAAEADWAAFGVERELPLVIFRLPGIYGPGRSAFDAIRAGRARRIFKEGQVFNRMHVDDIAATLVASINRPAAGDLFNLADDEPSPPQDVVEYACRLLGVEPPPLVSIDETEMSAMARSFYADNKRVSNARMKEALGARLLYPSYREGLAAIFEAERAAGGPSA